MKKNRWITLLSIALCATAAFTACDKEEGGNTVAPPAAAPTVEATFSNFIKAEYKADWKDMSANGVSLSERYGKYADNYGAAYLFKKEGVTALDEKSQVWTLYNADSQTAVWTKEFKYQNGDYTGNNEYGDEKRLPLNVGVTISDVSGMPYLKVVVEKNEEYTAEEIQTQYENVQKLGGDMSDVESYKKTTTYEYYTVDGKYICTSASSLSVRGDATKNELSFGNLMGVKLDKDGNTVAVWNLETVERPNIVEETDKYFYTTGAYNGGSTIEVYDKADNALVYRYYVGGIFEMMQHGGEVPIRVLQDGDLFIQTEASTDNAKYDYFVNGVKYDVTSKRIDVETGSVVEKDFPYVVEEFYSKAEFADVIGEELSLTDNVYNVAKVKKITDGALGDTAYIFFDNLLNVQYEWSVTFKGQEFSTDIDVLSTGDFLINLKTPVTVEGLPVHQAIIKPNGDLVHYIPTIESLGSSAQGGLYLTDNAILVGNAEIMYVYDFNGAKVDEFNVANGYYDYQYEDLKRFGNGYLLYGTKEVDDGNGGTEIHRILYRIAEETYSYYDPATGKYEESGYSAYNWGQEMEIVACEENYLVLHDVDRGRYFVYDGAYDKLLSTSERPTVEVYGDRFIVVVGQDAYEFPVYETVNPDKGQ